jgi:6-pyruvoyl-tetrahydropterin synthase
MPQLFVNRLTVMDFSYLHPERGLLGESWLVDIVLGGALDDQGMVLDFGEVKRSVKQLVDERFDHKLLVPTRYPGLEQSPRRGLLHLDFALQGGGLIQHSSPEGAVCPIDAAEVSPESVADAIVAALRPTLPGNVESLHIRLYPESIDGVFYHYSHGLKHHCGNCQRIAHGHRSRLLIERNGERDPELEADWALHWRDIYIGSREDLMEEADGQMLFGYHSQQGRFLLRLPAARCYLVDNDSTVEYLAQHVADTLKAQHPADSFRVWAYEGVNKGAIGEA